MAAFGLPSLPKQAASRRAALTVKVHFPPTSTENQGCFWFETLIVLEPPNGTTDVSLNLLTFCACLNCRRALNSDLGKTTRGAPRLAPVLAGGSNPDRSRLAAAVAG